MADLCGAAGCSVPASTNSAYCARHNGRRARHGHPDGRGLRRELLPYYFRTRNVLHPLRQAHEGLKRACDDLDALLRQWGAAQEAGRPLRSFQRELARLGTREVDGLDMIEAVAAVPLLDAEQPRVLRDTRSLRFAVARFVCALGPMDGARLGATSAIPMAEFLIDRYAPLFAVILRRFAEERMHDERLAQAMAEPMPYVTGS